VVLALVKAGATDATAGGLEGTGTSGALLGGTGSTGAFGGTSEDEMC